MEFIRELRGWAGDACLVRHLGNFYVVSSVNAMFSGFETLVFESDDNGNVTDYSAVAGGRGMSRDEAIADLVENHSVIDVTPTAGFLADGIS